MPDIKLIAHDLPVQPLLDAIRPEMWDDITAREKYAGPHGDTRCIFIRGPNSFLNFFDATAQDYPRCEELGPYIVPILMKIPAIRSHLLARIMIVSLKAGGQVHGHTDTGLYADQTERFHVVLSSNKACAYYCDSDVLCPEAGEAFWFDHHKPHRSHNAGLSDRVHLIVDQFIGVNHERTD